MQVLLDDRDLRLAMNWVAHNLYAKARSPSIPKIPNSQILTHGFEVDLEIPYGKKIRVEFFLKVTSCT